MRGVVWLWRGEVTYESEDGVGVGGEGFVLEVNVSRDLCQELDRGSMTYQNPGSSEVLDSGVCGSSHLGRYGCLSWGR